LTPELVTKGTVLERLRQFQQELDVEALRAGIGERRVPR
jgi:hypothetical protein